MKYLRIAIQLSFPFVLLILVIYMNVQYRNPAILVLKFISHLSACLFQSHLALLKFHNVLKAQKDIKGLWGGEKTKPLLTKATSGVLYLLSDVTYICNVSSKHRIQQDLERDLSPRCIHSIGYLLHCGGSLKSQDLKDWWPILEAMSWRSRRGSTIYHASILPDPRPVPPLAVKYMSCLCLWSSEVQIPV